MGHPKIQQPSTYMNPSAGLAVLPNKNDSTATKIVKIALAVLTLPAAIIWATIAHVNNLVRGAKPPVITKPWTQRALKQMKKGLSYTTSTCSSVCGKISNFVSSHKIAFATVGSLAIAGGIVHHYWDTISANAQGLVAYCKGPSEQ